MNEYPDYFVKQYSVDFDLTGFLNYVIRIMSRQDEKQLLHSLILVLSEHMVEMVRILSGAHAEMSRRMPAFFQKRVAAHRRALRWKRLISFGFSGSVEEEAARRAWEDTRGMIGELSVFRDESVTALMGSHRDILMRLCTAILSLVLERPGIGIRFDGESFRNFLE